MVKRQKLTLEQRSSPCPTTSSAPATVIVSSDDEDEDDAEVEHTLEEFVPKKRGEQHGMPNKKEGETAEEELGA